MSKVINRTISVDLIDPHPRNYKVHPTSQLEALKASREEYDQYDIAQFQSLVLWARPTGRYILVIGHGRVEAWQEDGVTEVRADILPQETPKEIIESILVSNDLFQRMARINQPILSQLLKEQIKLGRNVSALGMMKQEADKLMHQLLAEQKTDFLNNLLATPPPIPMASTRESDPGKLLPEQQAFPTEGSGWFPVNLTVSHSERQIILSAVSRAKGHWSHVHTQSEAIVAICQQFLEQ